MTDEQRILIGKLLFKSAEVGARSTINYMKLNGDFSEGDIIRLAKFKLLLIINSCEWDDIFEKLDPEGMVPKEPEATIKIMKRGRPKKKKPGRPRKS